MKLIKFSRSFWETAVSYKGSDEIILRDYDILMARRDGKTIGQISIKFGISGRQVINILNKYK